MLRTTVRVNWKFDRWKLKLMDSTDARGHYTIGKELVDDVIDRIRRVAGKFITLSRRASF